MELDPASLLQEQRRVPRQPADSLFRMSAIEHDAPDDYGAPASHNLQYGHTSYSMGDTDRALPHYREAIRYDQMQGNIFGAAKPRFQLAIAPRDVGASEKPGGWC